MERVYEEVLIPVVVSCFTIASLSTKLLYHHRHAAWLYTCVRNLRCQCTGWCWLCNLCVMYYKYLYTYHLVMSNPVYAALYINHHSTCLFSKWQAYYCTCSLTWFVGQNNHIPGWVKWWGSEEGGHHRGQEWHFLIHHEITASSLSQSSSQGGYWVL